jgi:hypothetical protein
MMLLMLVVMEFGGITHATKTSSLLFRLSLNCGYPLPKG